MKKLLNKNKIACLLLIGIVLFTACNSKQEKAGGEHEHAGHDMSHKNEAIVYTCPMHPEIIRNQPGACPVCGMDLVQKGVLENVGELGLGAIVEPVNETVIGNAKVTVPVKKAIASTVEAKGYITYNPKNTFSVSSRYSGRIDKLYVKYNFQEVTKGQKIMDIYSPDLLTAQQNYIFLLNNNEEEEAALLNASIQKLRLLGMTEEQVKHLQKTRKAEYLVSIYAPASGHIHQMSNLDELTMPVMPMAESAVMGTAQEFNIREGIYVKKGETVFNIISLSQVWVILKIYPQDVAKLKVGQPVEIVSEIAPDNPISAKISFIEPVLEKDSKFISARVYLDKCDHHIFKIGSLVHANINTGQHQGLWIPISAMLDLGNSNAIVFKKAQNHFKTYKVTAGTKLNKEVNILDGLTEADTIATDAWYMIDSESFVLTK